MAKGPELSAERIARAALDLLDSEGASGLTMRRLASRLGVKAASLYYHFPSQDHIVYAMQDLVNSEIDCTPLRSSDAAGLTAFAQSYRRAYLRHPNLVDLVSRRPLESETALVIYDEVSRHLRARGVAADQVMTFLTLLDYVVLGSAGETLYSDFHRPHASYRLAHPALAEALGAADAATVDDAAFALAMRLYEEAVARVTATS